MPKSTPHKPTPTDTHTQTTMNPDYPREREAPRTTGHKVAEPNPDPKRPGDDERDVGLVKGGASPTAPAKHVNPSAQRAAEEKIHRDTQV